MIARFASLFVFLAAGNLASAFVTPSAVSSAALKSSSTSSTSLDVLARYRNNYYQDTDREYDVNNRYYNNNDSYYGRSSNSRNSWYDGTSSNSLANQRDQYRNAYYGRNGSTSVSNGRPYFNSNYSGNYNSGYNSGYNANSYDNYYYRPNSGSASSYYNSGSTSPRNGYSVYNNDYAADSMVDHELAKIRNKGRFAIENELYNTYGLSFSHETTKDELALYLLKCRLGQNPMANNYNSSGSRTRYNNSGYGNGYNSGYGNGYNSGYGNTGYNNKYSNSYSYKNGNTAGGWVDNASDNYWRN
jgi:hypothetical protein